VSARTIRLRRITALVRDAGIDSECRPYVALEHVESATGKLLSGVVLETRYGGATGSIAVEPGDVLFGKLRPYLAKVLLIKEPMYASGQFFAMRPDPGRSLSAFLSYLALSRTFVGWADATSVGATMPYTRWGTLSELLVSLPSLARQQQISAHLDAESARIEGLIEKKTRLLDLMSARRASAIAEALQSSDCSLLPLRRVVAAFVDYRGATPEKSLSGVPLVTATNVSDGEIDLQLGEQFVTEETYSAWMRRGFPEAGDVLLTTEAPLGNVAMINDPRVALAQRIILLKPDRARVLPEFLYASLRSTVVQADLLSRASGSTVSGIRADRLRDVLVHLGNFTTQELVVRRMQVVDNQYRQARELLESQIALLRERRATLITDAVAGHLDVAKAPV
jgi:type I restriction enzyme S subunit